MNMILEDLCIFLSFFLSFFFGLVGGGLHNTPTASPQLEKTPPGVVALDRVQSKSQLELFDI